MTVDIRDVDLSTADTGNVVSIRLTGKLTTEDYARFVPVIEEAIARHGKIRLLLELRDFHGWTAGALWEDTKFDMHHFNDLERLAIVGEKRWEKGMAIFCKPFTTAEIRYFDVSEREAAEAWIAVS